MSNRLRAIKLKAISSLFIAAFMLPQYPQSEKVSEQKIQAQGMRFVISVYKTSDSEEQVIEFYKKALGEDFKFSGDAQYALFINKNGLSINLSCQKNFFDNTTLVQAYYNLDPSEGAGKAGPGAQDVPMPRDLYWLRPYPNSQQISVADTDTEFRVVYESKDNCQQCLIDYYRKEFFSWGWELIKEGKKDISMMPQKFPEGTPQETQRIIKKLIDSLPQEGRTAKVSYYLMMFSKGDDNCSVTISSGAADVAQAMIVYRR